MKIKDPYRTLEQYINEGNLQVLSKLSNLQGKYLINNCGTKYQGYWIPTYLIEHLDVNTSTVTLRQIDRTVLNKDIEGDGYTYRCEYTTFKYKVGTITKKAKIQMNSKGWIKIGTKTYGHTSFKDVLPDTEKVCTYSRYYD